LYKLDKKAFKMQTFDEASDYCGYWLSKTVAERLNAAAYLNSIAFNYPLDNPLRMDKSIFKIRYRS
jgi:hypothetical protein